MEQWVKECFWSEIVPWTESPNTCWCPRWWTEELTNPHQHYLIRTGTDWRWKTQPLTIRFRRGFQECVLKLSALCQFPGGTACVLTTLHSGIRCRVLLTPANRHSSSSLLILHHLFPHVHQMFLRWRTLQISICVSSSVHSCFYKRLPTIFNIDNHSKPEHCLKSVTSWV